MQLANQNEAIKEAFDAVRRDLWSEEELRGYHYEEKRRMDEQAEKKLAYRKAKEEGREEGREEAQAEAAKEKLQTAKNFLAIGLDVKTVAGAMGLSLEQVEALKNHAMQDNSPALF